MKILASVLASFLVGVWAPAGAQQTCTIPSHVVQVTIPQETCTPAVTIPPVVTPPPTGSVLWVYHNGTFAWPGDYSWNGRPNYADTVGKPGGKDISFTLSGPWGGWQPYGPGTNSGNFNFNTKGYTYLTFDLKPTVGNQLWQTQFLLKGDIPVGKILNVFNYGPLPVAGKWATYKVPLSDLGVMNTDILKFSIQDQTGMSNNVWYIDNVGFVP